MKIRKELYPYIIIFSLVIFSILGLILGFTPGH